MRWLLVWQSFVGVVQGFGHEGLHTFEATGHLVDEPLLLVERSAKLLDETLQVAVAHFDFGEAVVVHGRQPSAAR